MELLNGNKPWSEIILEFRRRLKMSQEQFATYTGTSKATVIRWEKGSCKPQPAICQHIMNLAKKSRDYKTSNLIQEIIEKSATPKNKIAEKIFQIRIKSKLSQDEFAREIGINPRTIQRWEQGLSSPSMALWYLILEKFNNLPGISL